MNWFKTTSIVYLFTLALFGFVLFTASIAISPSLEKLDYYNYANAKQAQIIVLKNSMIPTTVIATIAGVILLILKRKNPTSLFFILTSVSLFLILASLVYSFFTDIPLNDYILTWKLNSPPADWLKARDDWAFANLVRTFPVVGAFLIQLIAYTYSPIGEKSKPTD